MSQYPNQEQNSQQDQSPHQPPMHHGHRPVYSHGPQPGHGLAVASMVLGIVALVGIVTYGWVLAIVGIILAIIAKNKGYRGGMATAGLVCSIISLSLGLLLFVACTAFFVTSPWWMLF